LGLVKVPCSSANLGPGFDVMGLALSSYLVVEVFYGSNKGIKIIYKGEGEGKVPLDDTNLILSSAKVLEKKVKKSLPENLNITIHNTIPLGGGLGSSGSAIVAGVLVADKVLNLKLSRESLLAVCVEIEGHPDNVTPSLMGGCVACCGREQIPVPTETVPFPPRSYYIKVPVDKAIRFIAVTPDFHLATSKARAALPAQYSKKDVIFNLQRVATLVAGLGSIEHKEKLREALKDTVHQPYRAKLIPGFETILNLRNDPEMLSYGLIGLTLSGAGPSVLATVHSDNQDHLKSISSKIESIFLQHNLKSKTRFLSIDNEGALITTKSKSKL
jgi:homoserine kinase